MGILFKFAFKNCKDEGKYLVEINQSFAHKQAEEST